MSTRAVVRDRTTYNIKVTLMLALVIQIHVNSRVRTGRFDIRQCTTNNLPPIHPAIHNLYLYGQSVA